MFGNQRNYRSLALPAMDIGSPQTQRFSKPSQSIKINHFIPQSRPTFTGEELYYQPDFDECYTDEAYGTLIKPELAKLRL